ncbi:hypothetical protein BD413DRAFT_204097 [Trametes elegans]|nr:hypothetical protein BD413DRAFT_204097 [Trametes elegans]
MPAITCTRVLKRPGFNSNVVSSPTFTMPVTPLTTNLGCTPRAAARNASSSSGTPSTAGAIIAGSIAFGVIFFSLIFGLFCYGYNRRSLRPFIQSLLPCIPMVNRGRVPHAEGTLPESIPRDRGLSHYTSSHRGRPGRITTWHPPVSGVALPPRAFYRTPPPPYAPTPSLPLYDTGYCAHNTGQRRDSLVPGWQHEGRQSD